MIYNLKKAASFSGHAPSAKEYCRDKFGEMTSIHWDTTFVNVLR